MTPGQILAEAAGLVREPGRWVAGTPRGNQVCAALVFTVGLGYNLMDPVMLKAFHALEKELGVTDAYGVMLWNDMQTDAGVVAEAIARSVRHLAPEDV